MTVKQLVYLFTIGLLMTPHLLSATSQIKGDSTRHFRLSPYLWLVGFQGTLSRPPVPSLLPSDREYEIDVEFKDIRSDLKFIGMLTGQYQVKRLITQFNIASVILESEAITQDELLLQNNIIKLNFFSGDFGAGYRIIDSEKFEWDALFVLKFIYFKIGLSTRLAGVIQLEGERKDLWLEPVIGTNLKYKPHPKWEMGGYVDLGYGIINSDDSYQYFLGVNYFFTRTFFSTLGYRTYYLDRPIADLVFKGTVKGPLFKIGFRF